MTRETWRSRRSLVLGLGLLGLAVATMFGVIWGMISIAADDSWAPNVCYLRAAWKTFVSQPAMASETTGLTVASDNEAYSSISPVVAGTSR